MNEDELVEVVTKWLDDATARKQFGTRGRELVEKNRGALGEVCELIDDDFG